MKVSVKHSMCVKQAPIIIGSAACFISDLVHWWGSFVASASRASELQCMVCILFLQSKLENQMNCLSVDHLLAGSMYYWASQTSAAGYKNPLCAECWLLRLQVLHIYPVLSPPSSVNMCIVYTRWQWQLNEHSVAFSSERGDNRANEEECEAHRWGRPKEPNTVSPTVRPRRDVGFG